MAPSANLRGIVAMLIAVAFFSWMDAVMKLLVAHYPAMQVAALRGLTALPLVLVYVAWLGHGRQLWRVRWGLHALRGVLTVLMLVCFAWGLGALPMAEAYTLFFVAPLLITMLSIPVLKERVAPRHWLAIAAGLGGVLVALRPSGERFLSLGALAVLVAAACYAASAIAGRLLTRTDGASSLVFWTTVALALGAGLLALPSCPRTPGCCWRWRSPASAARSRSPRPSAPARPRWSRPSSTARWPGALGWTGGCGRWPPTRAPWSAARSSSPAACS
ncbi:DMT family transporter [Piscinibacter sakaiensis]|uniref:DMT family transporter n=1 Tax=Piscinibacter sakaiensis TaxID=1547922 RepID=UPI0037265248